jgi:DNA modification methylase
MKPVPLIARCIRNITSEGAVVVDPFMGSGTSLVAAEEMNRRAIGMELDPRYVDVAVRRWSTLTGLTAFHAETGEPFRLARVGE